MRIGVISAALLACAACGSSHDDSAAFGASLVLQGGLSAAAVASVDVYVLAGKTSGGDALTCATLGRGPLLLRSDLDVRLHRLLPLADATLSALTPAKALVVAVDAYPSSDGTGQRIAFGCADGIDISAGHAAMVSIDLAPP